MQFKMDGLAIATDEKTADSTNKPDESVKEIGRSKVENLLMLMNGDPV